MKSITISSSAKSKIAQPADAPEALPARQSKEKKAVELNKKPLSNRVDTQPDYNPKKCFMIEKMPEAYRLQKQLIKEFKPPADV